MLAAEAARGEGQAWAGTGQATGCTLEFVQVGWSSPQRGLWPPQPAALWPGPSGLVSPGPEPSVEEKLQKLHSEIKFALKVDNPVRSSWGLRAVAS